MPAATPLIQPEGRVLPTLEADGSRRWLTPKLSKGRFWNARRLVAYGLILLFNVLPFIRVGGKPIVLLDLAARELTLLGYTFLPRDTILLALLLVSTILAVFLFTSVLGRVWCGWGCPQTVYLEYVYRPIERLFLGRSGVGGKPARGLAPWRYLLMYLAFLVFSVHIGNTFLAYFVGAEQLHFWTRHSPLDHPTGFLIVSAVALAMMVDFAFLREQVCSVMCPYARFQSVLLDRNSLVVRYDYTRGEPRGKASRNHGSPDGSESFRIALPILERQQLTDLATAPSTAPSRGDCVDCTLCVQVCPTGIDIRDGVQLECINCAQCADACDAVMTKLGRPTGLVRYTSQSILEGNTNRLLRPRTLAYAAAITLALSLLTYLLITKSPVDMLLVRNQGLPYMVTPDGLVQNTMRLQLTNRTKAPQALKVDLVQKAGTPPITLAEANSTIALEAGKAVQLPIHFKAIPGAFTAGKHEVTVRITTQLGQTIERRCELFGPPS